MSLIIIIIIRCILLYIYLYISSYRKIGWNAHSIFSKTFASYQLYEGRNCLYRAASSGLIFGGGKKTSNQAQVIIHHIHLNSIRIWQAHQNLWSDGIFLFFSEINNTMASMLCPTQPCGWLKASYKMSKSKCSIRWCRLLHFF